MVFIYRPSVVLAFCCVLPDAFERVELCRPTGYKVSVKYLILIPYLALIKSGAAASLPIDPPDQRSNSQPEGSHLVHISLCTERELQARCTRHA